jgi:hypothetical protein
MMAIVRQLRNRYFFALDVVLLITSVVLGYVLRLENFSFNQLGSGFLFSPLLMTGTPRFAVRLSAQYVRRRPEPRPAATNALVLSSLTDGVLTVIDYGTTRIGEAVQGRNQLDQSGAYLGCRHE